MSDDYPEFTIALADTRENGSTIRSDNVPFVKWGGSPAWAVPGCEGDECNDMAEILRLHSDVRVLKPGSHEWVDVES